MFPGSGKAFQKHYLWLSALLIVVLCFQNWKFRSLLRQLAGDFRQCRVQLLFQRPGAPQKGRVEPPISVVEFSNFDCTSCVEQYQNLTALSRQFPGKISWSYKHFPLVLETGNGLAVFAAMAAHLQGKFWEMRERITQEKGGISKIWIWKTAQEMGLDPEKLTEDMDPELWRPWLEGDFQDGLAEGVSEAPTLVINGHKIIDGDYAFLKKFVEDLLAELGEAN